MENVCLGLRRYFVFVKIGLRKQQLFYFYFFKSFCTQFIIFFFKYIRSFQLKLHVSILEGFDIHILYSKFYIQNSRNAILATDKLCIVFGVLYLYQRECFQHHFKIKSKTILFLQAILCPSLRNFTFYRPAKFSKVN